MKTAIDIFVTNKVRERREALGISQEALSYKIDRTGTFVANVENNTRKYNVNHLNLLAIALRCPISYFFPPEPIIEVRPQKRNNKQMD